MKERHARKTKAINQYIQHQQKCIPISKTENLQTMFNNSDSGNSMESNTFNSYAFVWSEALREELEGGDASENATATPKGSSWLQERTPYS
eukprot:6052979-Amphidinium_carterae.1